MSFSISINPGSGPVQGATQEQAEANMRQFAADLHERGHARVTYDRKPEADYDLGFNDGRFCWIVAADGGELVEVQMPGLPLDRVRWLGSEQDIWQFPRLYVDDGSWIWFFALDQFDPEDAPSLQPNGTVRGGEPYQFTTISLTATEE